jgi:RNA polymerase sigma factor (sigma-70 family)
MKTSRLEGLIRRLCHHSKECLTDRELVDALAEGGDEASFEALLKRHGPMVLAVCRRVLRNEHDAEDAFQSTFLVLIRRAGGIRKREAVASWLYGVAYLCARKARHLNARRRLFEAQATRPGLPQADACNSLDEEISALPERYRTALVLCELQGRSRREVARSLNIPEGTLSSRLAMARKMLAKRIRRHGRAQAIVPLVAGLPPSLVTETLAAGGLALAGRPVAEALSPAIVRLTEGASRAMFVSKLKALTVAVAVVAALGVGTERIARATLSGALAGSADQPVPPVNDPLLRPQTGVAAAEAEVEELYNKAVLVDRSGNIPQAVQLYAKAGSLGVIINSAVAPQAIARANYLLSAAPRGPGPVADSRFSLMEAEAEVQKAEAHLAVAKQRLELKRRQQREALARNAPQLAARPEDRADLSARTRQLMSRFKYRVPVELGASESKDGGRIEILDVWGTQPEIKVGGCYMVHGKYSMPCRDRGTLYFHLSATDNRFAFAYENDLQCASIQKGEGEFTLMHIMVGPGYFHLQLIGENLDQPSTSTTVADLYFGTGDNVCRRK